MSSVKPLFIPLKREWFEAFAAGEKFHEIRPYGARWNERTCTIGRSVTLSLGYGKLRRLKGVITSFEQSALATRTPAWQSCYGQSGHPLAAVIGISLD